MRMNNTKSFDSPSSHSTMGQYYSLNQEIIKFVDIIKNHLNNINFHLGVILGGVVAIFHWFSRSLFQKYFFFSCIPNLLFFSYRSNPWV